MFERILLPVDGSSHAVKAAGVAGDLAAKYESEVLILHVIDESRHVEQEERMAEIEHAVPPDRGPFPWVANVPAELAAMLQPEESSARHRRVLEFLAERVVRAASDELVGHGVPAERIRAMFRTGHPVKSILDTCERESSDLVVMGSRGLTDLAGAIGGSVSHRVAHGAPCSVITVK